MRKLPNKESKVKNQTGITLVALVVTIVVLLILAGVSIITLFGESGIITKAQKAKQETENGVTNDLSGLGNAENIIDKYTRESNRKNVKYREFTATLYVGTYTKALSSNYINTKIEICELNASGEETGAKMVYTLGKGGTIEAKNDDNYIFNETTSSIDLGNEDTTQSVNIKVKIAENTDCKIKLYKQTAKNRETGYETEELVSKVILKNETNVGNVLGTINEIYRINDINADGVVNMDDSTELNNIISGTTYSELAEYTTQVNEKNVITLADANGRLIDPKLLSYICYDVNRDGKIDENDVNDVIKAFQATV